jgi:uncharacterized protein (DUF1697 family)
MSVYVVLLRAIGPLTHPVMSMAQWRAALTEAGYGGPQTYLATGNLVVESELPRMAFAAEMNRVVRELGLGAHNLAVVREVPELAALVAADPFPEASRTRPAQMGVYFFAEPVPHWDWLATLNAPEPTAVVDGHLVVDFVAGTARAASLSARIERLGGPATARNWNTLRGLHDRALLRTAKD